MTMRKTSRLVVPLLTTLASFVIPFAAAAQTGINVPYLQSYSTSISDIVNKVLVPLLLAIAFLVFLWGVYKYFIQGAASDTERETGKQFTLWSVIGFVVIFSLWGILYIIRTTLGLASTGTPPPTPTINTSPSSSSNTTSGSAVPSNVTQILPP